MTLEGKIYYCEILQEGPITKHCFLRDRKNFIHLALSRMEKIIFPISTPTCFSVSPKWYGKGRGNYNSEETLVNIIAQRNRSTKRLKQTHRIIKCSPHPYLATTLAEFQYNNAVQLKQQPVADFSKKEFLGKEAKKGERERTKGRTLTIKPERYYKKGKIQTDKSHEHGCRIPNKSLANQIQQCIKIIMHYKQIGFISSMKG